MNSAKARSGMTRQIVDSGRWILSVETGGHQHCRQAERYDYALQPRHAMPPSSQRKELYPDSPQLSASLSQCVSARVAVA